jgi:hypothetical protein
MSLTFIHSTNKSHLKLKNDQNLGAIDQLFITKSDRMKDIEVISARRQEYIVNTELNLRTESELMLTSV